MTDAATRRAPKLNTQSIREWVSQAIKQRTTTLLLIIIFASVFISFFEPRFLSTRNITSLFMGMTYELFLAMGMTLVLILGGIDLSVGSVLGLAGVTLTMLLSQHQPFGLSIPLAIFIGLSVSALMGLINGLNVSKLKIAPFVATLGMMAIARGLGTVWTSGWYVSGLPEGYVQIGQGTLFGIPYPIYFAVGIMIIFSILLKRWQPLSQAYYIGQNPEAAKMSGLRVSTIMTAGYVVSGLFAGIAALFMTSRLAVGFFQFGLTGELNAIAAAVIGGASFAGGRGSLFGTFLGVLLIAVINNGFVLLQGDPNYKTLVQGLIVFVAIGVDAYRRRNEVRE